MTKSVCVWGGGGGGGTHFFPKSEKQKRKKRSKGVWEYRGIMHVFFCYKCSTMTLHCFNSTLPGGVVLKGGGGSWGPPPENFCINQYEIQQF